MRSYEVTVSGRDGTTNEKDKDIAGGIIYQINKERRGHLMGDCAGEKCPDWITRQSEIISKALATVRAEEMNEARTPHQRSINMDEVSRLALSANQETTTLKQGRTVHVDGVPYELLNDVEAFSATKPLSELTPEDVIGMSLAEFEKRFGFRPVDALEKKFFAVTGKRPDQFQRDAIKTGILGDTSHDGVVME